MAIGYGNLPNALTVDSETYTGWFVPSPSSTVLPAFYSLQVVSGVQAWVREDTRIHYPDDPVVDGNQTYPLNELAQNQLEGWILNEW